MSLHQEEDTDIATLQAEYAAALARNTDAKARLRRTLREVDGGAQSQSWATPRRAGDVSRGVGSCTSRQKLEVRLAALRTERRCVGYDALRRGYERLEEIAREEGVYDADGGERRDRGGDGEGLGRRKLGMERAQKRVDGVMREVDRGIERLEMAVVKESRKVRRERAEMERARDRAAGSVEGWDGVDGSKLRAVEGAREMLQAWIEESLARCELPVEGSELEVKEEGDEELENEHGDRDGDIAMLDQERRWTEEDVAHEYEKYIETRKRVLRAVEGLRAPMAMPSPVKAGSSPKKAVRQLGGIGVGHHRQGSIHDRDGMVRLSLRDIESQILPQHELHQALSTHLTNLQQRNTNHNARLLQVLNSLSHESHLLPAHPQTAAAERTKVSISDELDQNQLAVMILLEAWAFASREADQSLGEVVTKHVEAANIALDDAEEHVDQTKMMNMMRKEVERPLR